MINVYNRFDEDFISIIAKSLVEKNWKILDVGGAYMPLRSATHVIDIVPFAGRRVDVGRGPLPECFSEKTWVQRDICELPWPYKDNSFDFIWCSQVVEDIRDPIAVLKECQRLAPQGFVSTVHRQFESSANVSGTIGYAHHKWLVDANEETNEVTFTFKTPLLQVDPATRSPLSDKWLYHFSWWRPFEVKEQLYLEGEIYREALRVYAEGCK